MEEREGQFAGRKEKSAGRRNRQDQSEECRWIGHKTTQLPVCLRRP